MRPTHLRLAVVVAVPLLWAGLDAPARAQFGGINPGFGGNTGGFGRVRLR
jgi:hypothetical protein